MNHVSARRGGLCGLAGGTIALLLAGSVAAQSLCDIDGDGQLTEMDGITVLQSAALLETTCVLAVCDTDGDGEITDTDGVNVLRAAAALSSSCEEPLPDPICGDGIRNSAEACDGSDDVLCASGLCRQDCTCEPVAGGGAAITDFVPAIRGAGGQSAMLRVGAAPIPGAGAPMTINDLDGTGEVAPSGSGNASFGVVTNGSAQAAGIGGTTLLVRVRDATGVVATGFYELALGTNTVDLDFDVANLAAGTGFFLDFATEDAAGVVSVYETLDVVIVCIIAFEACVGGPSDGEPCNSAPCETACNPTSCDEPACPGGECGLVIELGGF